MPAKRTRRDEGIHEPNMTPLIDVSLVLVVILMVATPIALQSGIGVSRAHEGGRDATPVRSEWIEVSVLPGDRVRVNRDEMPRAAMGPALEARLAESATRRVLVRCADDVPHGTFVAVLDEARARGAGQIAVLEAGR